MMNNEQMRKTIHEVSESKREPLSTRQSGHDGTILEPWVTESNTLPEPLHASRSVVFGSRVYLLGGRNNNGTTNSIYSAPIHQDNTLGEWVIEENTLPEPLEASQLAVTGAKVYLLGGYNGKNKSNFIYSAPIRQDGTLGKWIIEPNRLPEALCISQLVATSSRVYLLGGENNVTETNKIYSAPVNSDGTLGEWVTESSTLPEALCLSQVVTIGNKVYLLGGYNRGESNSVYSTTINDDGTLGEWVIEPNTLPGTLYNSQVVTNGNKAYLLGGYIGSGKTGKVYSVDFGNDGTIGTWTTESSTLPDTLYLSQTVHIGNRVYLLGGVGRDGVTDSIYSAPIGGV